MSAPELEHVDDHVSPKRKLRWVIVVGVLLIVVAMVASLGGAWSAFVPGGNQQSLQDLKLESSAIPASGDFGAQQPNWTDCGDGFVCADVHAPLDWADLEGDTILLRLVKHPAANGSPLGTLFVNPGGPGVAGASFIRDSLEFAVGAPLIQNYDVIGWDPRGVGSSSQVRCLTDSEMDDYLFGNNDEFDGLERGGKQWIAKAIDSSRELGEACLDKTGPLLGHVDTMSTVRDLEMLREISGDSKLNYLGYSYGTFIGAKYAEAYPTMVGRMTLDGVLDPAASNAEVVREQTRGFELALRSYAEACLDSQGCPLSGSVDEAMAQIGEMLDAVDADPLTGSDGRTFSSSTFLTAIVTPLYSESSWGYLNQLFEDVKAGNANIGLALADSYYSRVDGKYVDNSTEAFMAINCLDYSTEIDPVRMLREAAELEKVAPTIGRFQGFGDVSCAGWPFPGVTERNPVSAEGAAPILIVGTTGDPATPFRWAESLSQQLESSVLLTYEGEGHTAYGKNQCVNDAVDNYFLTGATPQSGITCSAAVTIQA